MAMFKHLHGVLYDKRYMCVTTTLKLKVHSIGQVLNLCTSSFLDSKTFLFVDSTVNVMYKLNCAMYVYTTCLVGIYTIALTSL